MCAFVRCQAFLKIPCAWQSRCTAPSVPVSLKGPHLWLSYAARNDACYATMPTLPAHLATLARFTQLPRCLSTTPL